MPKLTIVKNSKTTIVDFEGGTLLDKILEDNGFQIPHPCAGYGRCGKCAVEISGDISEPTESEQKLGVRLSCQTAVFGDARVILPDDIEDVRIETNIVRGSGELNPLGEHYGAAVDIGTTTVAVKVYDLKTGECIGTSAKVNPQTSVAADVMGRIEAAMGDKGELLKSQITDAIDELIKSASGDKICDFAVLTGNTTMLYLLKGISPESLSHAPFIADDLFGCEDSVLGLKAYLPPCMNAFVGADITCAVLSSKMCESDKTSLLCDIGTNGEMALWKDGTLYVTSTAAGPAFEGAGISCGCGSVAGAIDKVWSDTDFRIHTIGEKEAVGICGSGLLDAIACGLQSGYIDETGAMDDDLILSKSVSLEPRDIRAVQLAKAAIAAGIETLLSESDTDIKDVETLYITGGFGSHLDINSGVRIGLLPEELAPKTKVLGNAALAGAVAVLLNKGEKEKLTQIANCSQHINLGGNPKFNDNYIEQMMFPE